MRTGLSWLIHIVCITLLSYGVIDYFQSNMDLSPMFGPGGVKSIAALVEDYPQRDWGTWLMNLCQRWTETELEAAQLCIWLGHLTTTVGVGLCALRLTGISGLRVVACMLLCYAPLIWNTLLIGPDGIATGIAWMGIGIAWISTKKRWWISMPLVALGAFLCIFAAKVKITALPCAAYLGVIPLLAMKPKWTGKLEGITVGLVCVGILLYVKQQWLPSTNNHLPTGQSAGLNMDSLKIGWTQLQTVFSEEDVIVQLASGALVALALPGRHWLTRITLGFLCAGVLCITANTLGQKIRPRYFVAAQLPIFILLTSAMTQYRWTRLLAQIGGLGIAGMLWMDAIAYHSAWSNMMTKLDGTDTHTLMEVPDGWNNRYSKFPRLDHDDHSTIGAKRLHVLATEASTKHVMGIPLRDGREHHLLASAGVSGHKGMISTPKYCCEHQPDLAVCAAQTVDALLRSNSRLILPIITKNHNRIPNDTRRWYQLLLRTASTQAGWKAEAEWGYIDGSGSQKAPCSRPPRRKKGFWEIDGEKHHKPHQNSKQRGMPDGKPPPQKR